MAKQPLNRTHSRPGFDKLVRSIYLISSGLEEVDLLIRGAETHFNSHLVGCIATNKLDSSTKMPFFMGLDEREQANYNTYYANKNVIVQASLPTLAGGGVVSSAKYFSDCELAKTEYYADFLRGLKAHYSAGIMVSSISDWFYSLIIARTKAQGAYSQQEMLDLAALRTHLEAAMHIGVHLNTLKSAIASRARVLDHMNIGVCLLGKKLRLLEANISAKDVLEDGTFLSAQSGCLTTGNSVDRRLAKLLHELSTGSVSSSVRIKVGDESDATACFLSVFPVLDPEVFWWVDSSEVKYVLFLCRHLAATSHCKGFLISEYGLSEREVELVELLIGGRSLAEAAPLLGIGHETARSHLKSVFVKMDIHSQAQLAMIVSRLNAIH